MEGRLFNSKNLSLIESKGVAHCVLLCFPASNHAQSIRLGPDQIGPRSVCCGMNNPGENTLGAEALECASAALLRGLDTEGEWPAIEARARALAVESGAQGFAARAVSLELSSAARALDAVAQGAPGGGALARERGVWAGAAYAAGGNFPSARVVMRRTFPRWRAPDDATAALMGALAPGLRGGLGGDLARALDDYFGGEARAHCVWQVWEAVENTVWAPEVWALARAGLEAALESATVRALRDVERAGLVPTLHESLGSAGRSPDGAKATPLSMNLSVRRGLRPLPICASPSNSYRLEEGASPAEPIGSWPALHAVRSTVTAKRAAQNCLEAGTIPAPVRFPNGFIEKLGAQLPTLLPPQLSAVRGGFLAGGNVLAALPPGTGKTLLGELFLASSLGSGPGLAVFLVPYVSLGRGVARALRAHFPDAIPVHRWLGGHGGDEKSRAEQRPEIAVMTPERFDALVRARPETWARLRGVVVDEAHTLSQGARGARLEGVIARIRARQNAGARLPLMLLSAALDERATLEEWAGIGQTLASSWTPTARRLAFWRSDGQMEWHAELAGGATRALGATALAWPQRVGHAQSWARVREREPLVWSNVAHGAHELHHARGGAILCLCATRRATREVARALGARFPVQAQTSGAAALCIEAIEARHRTLLPLARLIERGVAWHNSSLAPEVRDHLENAIESGQIHAVAATSTLAEGVDLPFAQTLVADWLSWNEGAQRPLPSGLFRNIAGRCGRAGAFTEGDTLVVDNPLGPAQWTAPDVRWTEQRRAFVGATLSEPRSALATETAEGQARDAMGATLQAQLLALKAEQEQLGLDETAKLFYAARQTDDFAARVAAIWADFEAQGVLGNGVLSARGAAFARTDWSPASCARLLGALECLPAQGFDDAAGASRLNAYLWRALGALPEAGGEIERFFRTRSRLVARPEHLEQIGRAWLRGDSPEAIFGALPRAQNLPGLGAWLERDEAPPGTELEVPAWNGEFDRFLDWTRAGLESWTPWLWRVAGIVAPLAGPRATRIRWQKWAMRWEAGADTDWATRALRLGAPGGRASCAVVGRHWPFATSDALALSPLRDEVGREKARLSLDAALREVGGPYCFAGRNLLALRDWIWARAGLSK